TAPAIAAASAAITATSATSAARLTRTALLAGIARILRLGLRSYGRLGGRGLDRRGFLVVVFVSHHQNSSPPSRAASASALTRPWNRYPPRSNTTDVTPAFFAASAICLPTSAAASTLAPEDLAPSVEAAATVRPAASSMSWA